MATNGRLTMTSARRKALLEAIDYLHYRIAICLEAEDRWSAEKGHDPISAATERSARMELELAVCKIGDLAILPFRSRKRVVADRAAHVAKLKVLGFSPTATATERRVALQHQGGGDAGER